MLFRSSDLTLVALPVAGAGYDVAGFARDFARYARDTGRAVALAAPQEAVRTEFEQAGLPAFVREREAILALKQLAEHSELMRREYRQASPVKEVKLPATQSRFLDEAQSLALLAAAGLPVVEHRLCRTEDAARAAFAEIGRASWRATV